MDEVEAVAMGTKVSKNQGETATKKVKAVAAFQLAGKTNKMLKAVNKLNTSASKCISVLGRGTFLLWLFPRPGFSYIWAKCRKNNYVYKINSQFGGKQHQFLGKQLLMFYFLYAAIVLLVQEKGINTVIPLPTIWHSGRL